jgi:hypothetical protein
MKLRTKHAKASWSGSGITQGEWNCVSDAGHWPEKQLFQLSTLTEEYPLHDMYYWVVHIYVCMSMSAPWYILMLLIPSISIHIFLINLNRNHRPPTI